MSPSVALAGSNTPVIASIAGVPPQVPPSSVAVKVIAGSLDKMVVVVVVIVASKVLLTVIFALELEVQLFASVTV